ncbi:uncharacterized protein LOC132742665, partial [Ruditapes philippinarum]|uniref:uncharacterized protein LOC132742665 n=1 Tax=Ruditapes philippinarum TaxID=129788 RepID=UPI00295B143B
CGFDPIKGGITQILFTTVPLLIIISANIILYILTWKRIKEHVAGITESLKTSSVTDKSRYAARNMSLFVLAFFIQWFACAVFSIWLFFDKNVPMFLIIANTTITNLGGTLNLGVCIILRHRDKECDRKGKECQSKENEKYQLPNVSLEIATVEEKASGKLKKNGKDKKL